MPWRVLLPGLTALPSRYRPIPRPGIPSRQGDDPCTCWRRPPGRRARAVGAGHGRRPGPRPGAVAVRVAGPSLLDRPQRHARRRHRRPGVVAGLRGPAAGRRPARRRRRRRPGPGPGPRAGLRRRRPRRLPADARRRPVVGPAAGVDAGRRPRRRLLLPPGRDGPDQQRRHAAGGLLRFVLARPAWYTELRRLGRRQRGAAQLAVRQRRHPGRAGAIPPRTAPPAQEARARGGRQEEGGRRRRQEEVGRGQEEGQDGARTGGGPPGGSARPGRTHEPP